MTEQEWLACTDPQPMLEFLRGKGSDRKLRLFACACCRSISHLLTDERSRNCIKVAERYAEGRATEQEREEAYDLANFAYEIDGTASEIAASTIKYPAGFDNAAEYIADGVASSVRALSIFDYSVQAIFLRDIFGPLPIRAIILNPIWLSSSVVALAETINDEKAFDRLPILADALEDAGCTNADILNHCRQPGEHVRGCWVVDLLLGKA